jgi:ABC-2 type transport system permease protein
MNSRAELLYVAASEDQTRVLPSSWAVEWGVISSLWKRDLLHLIRERSRWSGVVLQPLLFWLVIGSGMGSVFRLEGLEGVDYLAYFFPGILAMVVLFTAVFATMGVIEDRKSGFLQQILVAPGSHAALVTGKTAGVTTMALIQVVACLLVAPFAGVDLLAVNWPLLVLVLVLGCAGLTALNFVFAWLIDSTAGYHAIMSVLLLPLWIVSGAMFPANEGWTGYVMRVNPMAYLVDGMRHALHSSASVANASPTTCVVVLAASTVGFGLLAVWTITRRSEAGRV